MEYTIVLSEKDESDCIEAIALQNKLTATAYMTNIVRGWIHGQLRGQYLNAARVATLPELKTALSSIVEKIKIEEAKKAAGG